MLKYGRGPEARDKVICPYCQTKGKIKVFDRDATSGISGAKATGAILTGGLSVLFTGLAKRERIPHAHCDNCNMGWDL